MRTSSVTPDPSFVPLRIGSALNEPDPATFYGGAAEGYTDYPALA